MDLNLVARRMLFQEFTVVRQASQLLRLDLAEAIGESHISVRVMVTIRLAVNGNVNELRPGARVRKASQKAVGEVFSLSK